MANWITKQNQLGFKLYIPKYVKDNYYTEYEITVRFNSDIKWTFYKRYSEFLKLSEKLVKIDPKYKVHFPPKKTFNNSSDYFLDQRRKSLEIYLNEVILHSGSLLPRELALFLQMDRYEIHGITTNLAKYFFIFGTDILNQNKLFEIGILYLNAINQRLQSTAPTNLYEKSDEDFGNVLDVIRSIRRVKIITQQSNISFSSSTDLKFTGDSNDLGPLSPRAVRSTIETNRKSTNLSCSASNLVPGSNIHINKLTFDISVFTAATYMKLEAVYMANLRGLYKTNNTVEKLDVNYCLKSLSEILLGDLGFSATNIEYLKQFDGPWRCVKLADFSYNSLTDIHPSIVTLRAVTSLNLAHNQLTCLQYLKHLPYLSRLDVSFNNLYLSPPKSPLSHNLGHITHLSLSHNKLQHLTHLLHRLYCLEYLNISYNNIKSPHQLLPLCQLVCLEQLIIQHNPITSNSESLPLLYHLFLDRYYSIRINSLLLSETPPIIQNSVKDRQERISRHLNNPSYNVLNTFLLLSHKIRFDFLHRTTQLNQLPHLYNLLTYWFNCCDSLCHKAIPTVRLTPAIMLCCTELTSVPGLQPRFAVLVAPSCGTALLKCTVSWEYDSRIEADESVDDNANSKFCCIKFDSVINLNQDSLKSILVGSNTNSFIRFDFEKKPNSQPPHHQMFLVSNAADNKSSFSTLNSFLEHMFHADKSVIQYADSRLCHINEEDRMEIIRRFVDNWVWDLNFCTYSQMTGGAKRPSFSLDTPSHKSDTLTPQNHTSNAKDMQLQQDVTIHLCVRTLYKMRNKFKLLLTLVITGNHLLLIDEQQSTTDCFPVMTPTSSLSQVNLLPQSTPRSPSRSSFYLSQPPPPQNNPKQQSGLLPTTTSLSSTDTGSISNNEDYSTRTSCSYQAPQIIRTEALNILNIQCTKIDLGSGDEATTNNNSTHDSFVHQIKEHFPTFVFPVQIHRLNKLNAEPLLLYFESSALADQVCSIVKQFQEQYIHQHPAANNAQSHENTDYSNTLSSSPVRQEIVEISTEIAVKTTTIHHSDQPLQSPLFTPATKLHKWPKFTKWLDMSLEIIYKSTLLNNNKKLFKFSQLTQTMCKRESIDLLRDLCGLMCCEFELSREQWSYEDVHGIIGLVWSPIIILDYKTQVTSSLRAALLCFSDQYGLCYLHQNDDRTPSIDSKSPNSQLESPAHTVSSVDSTGDTEAMMPTTTVTKSNGSKSSSRSNSVSHSDSNSEPEVDQQLHPQDNLKCQPKQKNSLVRVPSDCVIERIPIGQLVRVFIGLNYQWIDLSFSGTDANNGEEKRVILCTRSSEVSKKIVNWINKKLDPTKRLIIEHSDEIGDLNELRYAIERKNKAKKLWTREQHNLSGESDKDVYNQIHFTSVAAIKLDKRVDIPEYLLINGDTEFSPAVAITNTHIILLQHNIVEYPVPIFGLSSTRKLPEKRNFKVLMCLPIYDCLQIQLPGHDTSQLNLLMRCNLSQVSAITESTNSVRSSTSTMLPRSSTLKHLVASQKSIPSSFSNTSISGAGATESSSSLTTLSLQLTIPSRAEQTLLIDRLRAMWSHMMQSDTALRVSVS